ncbi:ladinin-1 [Struthio camelus]|uniref:ladinin-1 n=1 Tax=Struthio camelus TaxID=8801 RepID=UPI00051E5190|nr:PREDICTED: ladinin-1 [Struthio camelus australis]
MSFNRKNWSDLSSLARQRTLEDEEEQQRERRRRHRSLLSSTSMDKDPPSPSEDVSPAPSRPQVLVKAVPLEEEEEQKLSEVLKTQEGRRTRSPVAISEKLRQKKEQWEPGARVSHVEPELQQHAGQESVLAGEQGHDAAKSRGTSSEDQRSETASERKVLTKGQLEDKQEQGMETQQGNQRSEVGEQQKQAVQEQRSCRLHEVKILPGGGSRSMEKINSSVTLPPGQQHPPRSSPKEVTQLTPTQDELAEKSDAPPTRITYSSSIRRSSPRTVSFRVISRKEREENPSPLTRSASLRIPGSSTTIEEKLEKYTSAVQRSEVVKSSLTVQKNLLLSSEGVASKRNFFEASTPPTKAEPLAVRKDNRKIPGSVTSRINLWISRTQEPSKEEKSKDTRKINSLTKRDVWVKQPRDSSGDTKL